MALPTVPPPSEAPAAEQPPARLGLGQVLLIALAVGLFALVWLVAYSQLNALIWENSVVTANRWLVPVGTVAFSLLVGLTVVMAIIFLVVIRHSDVARNQEINQKVYGNIAQRLVQDEILTEGDRADPATVRKIFDRIRLINPRVDVYLPPGAAPKVAPGDMAYASETVIAELR